MECSDKCIESKARLTEKSKVRRRIFSSILAAVIFQPLTVLADEGMQKFEQEDYHSAYSLLAPRAEVGESAAQTLVGFMLFQGKGVLRDVVQAQQFFEMAAEKGENVAMWNLIIINSLGLYGAPINLAQVDIWSSRIEPSFMLSVANGELHGPMFDSYNTIGALLDIHSFVDEVGKEIYQVFCAGCHGFNGLAFFPGAPSFLMGERLGSSDAELINSIMNGTRNMPPWGNKLTAEQIQKSLWYLRYLATKSLLGREFFDDGNAPKETYFTFKPMGTYWEDRWNQRAE